MRLPARLLSRQPLPLCFADERVRLRRLNLWERIRREPTRMRQLQGWLTILWVVMIPVSLATGWVKSVTFVSALSLWALVASHGAWWAAASVEATQAEEDIAADVVEKIVDKTDVEESA
jgi:hypothetical protein